MEVSFASEFEAFDEFTFGEGCTGLARLAGFGVDYDFLLERGCRQGCDFVLVVEGVDVVSEFVYARHLVLS
jgi:hypothetical protein